MRARSAIRLTLLIAALAGCSGGGHHDPAPVPPGPGAITVTGITPASGPDTGGTAVTITGTGFVSGATVAIGGNAAGSVVFVNATTLNCSTPTAAGAGTADVQVTNPDTGTGTLTNGFTYTSGGTGPAPTITLVAPGSGSTLGGTVITLSGTGFQAGATVLVGAAQATGVSVVSGTQITATTPAGSAGQVNVQVTNPDLQNATATNGFTYTAPAAGVPAVSGVSPNSGTTAGGTPVIVSGSNFALGATVTFGAAQATSVVVTSANQITCVTPAGSAGAVTVTVYNTPSNSGSQLNAFTYTTAGAALSVTGYSPASPTRPAAGGTGGAFTINGTGFANGAAVYIGGKPAAATFVSSTQLNVTSVPAAGVCAPASPNTVTVVNPSTATANGPAPGLTYVPDTVESLSSACDEPDVVIDGAGTIHVVFEGPGSGSGDVLYTRSTDGGRTWSAPTNLSSTSAASSVPRIACDGSNTLLVAWVQSGSTAASCDFRYSTNNGTSWSTTASTQLPSSGLGLSNGLDVALDGGANATIAYLWAAAMGPQSSTYVYLYTVSGALSGLASATELQINGIVTTNVGTGRPALAAGGSGTVLLTYTEGTIVGGPSVPGGARLEFTRSTNGGSSFATPTTLMNGGNGFGAMGVPAMALLAGNAVIAVGEMVNLPQTGIAYQATTLASNDTGATWGSRVTVGGTQSSWIHCAIAYDAAGFCTLVWDDTNSTVTDLACARSSDNGSTWTTPRFWTPTAVNSALPAAAGGAAGVTHVVWGEWNSTLSGYDIVHW